MIVPGGPPAGESTVRGAAATGCGHVIATAVSMHPKSPADLGVTAIYDGMRTMESSESVRPAPAPHGPLAAIRALPTPLLIAAIVLAGAVPSAVWAIWPEHVQPVRRAPPDPRYATQGASAARVRQAHIAQQADELADGAVETCGGVGLARLARKYRVTADPEMVARRYAASYEPAYRERVFRSCLSGIHHPG